MPLLKGKQNIGKNIKTEMAHGKLRKQAIAIALSVAGKAKKKKIVKHMGQNEKRMRNESQIRSMEKKLGMVYS